ncbi:MAG: ATP-binding protein [Anaerolineae bacterium]
MRRYGGLGLGLALVKMILDAHEAGFDIQTQAGEGTTVTVFLPKAG